MYVRLCILREHFLNAAFCLFLFLPFAAKHLLFFLDWFHSMAVRAGKQFSVWIVVAATLCWWCGAFSTERNCLPDERPSGFTASFVTMNVLPMSQGLTNQLLSYTGLISTALEMGRVAAIPWHTTPNFFEIVNATRTAESFPCSFNLLPLEGVLEQNPTQRRQKLPRLHLPGRSLVLRDANAAKRMYDSALRSKAGDRGVKLSSILWHVPYTTSTVRSEPAILRSLVFTDQILARAAKIREVLGSQYVGLHLRLESDIANFPFAKGEEVQAPSADQLYDLLATCVVPLLPKQVKVVYVSAGSLQSDHLGAVRRLEQQGFRVLTKRDIFKDTSLPSGGARATRITNHFDAAADMVVMEGSAVAVGADYSTFLRGVQFRRCPSQHLTFTYNRKFDSVTYRGCTDSAKHNSGEVWDSTSGFMASTPFNSLGDKTPPTCVIRPS